MPNAPGFSPRFFEEDNLSIATTGVALTTDHGRHLQKLGFQRDGTGNAKTDSGLSRVHRVHRAQAVAIGRKLASATPDLNCGACCWQPTPHVTPIRDMPVRWDHRCFPKRLCQLGRTA